MVEKVKTKEAPVTIHYNENWILANLTEQEFLCLIRREDNLLRTGNLGYIDPLKIKRYFSSEFNKTFDGSPKLSVRIDFEDEWKVSHIAGRYYFIHGDLNKEKGYDIILSGPILISDVEENKINAKYVVEDNSGKIIPVTEDRVKKGIERLEGLEIINPWDFNKIEKLSKVAGVDYSEKINKLKESTQRKVLERYSSRENLESVLERFEGTTEYACSSLFLDNDLYEGPDLEGLDEFLKFLPKIDLPSDIKERTIKFLNEYAQSFHPDIIEAEEKIKEDTERLKTLEGEQQYLERLSCMLRNQK